MTDIAPELLKKILTSFGKKLRDDDALSGLTEKLEKGTAVYADAQEYAYRVGAALSETFREELSSDVLPDGRMYFNIANRVVRDPLTRAYKLIADECEAVQGGLNRAAGIGLTPQRPAFPENRIKGFVDRISSEPNYDDVSWILGEPVKTYSQSIVDDSVRANAEQHYKAGLSPRIIRTAAAHCCEWCNDVAGTYDYPAVPKDVYRRHNSCRCQVEYDPRTGRRQDVHTRRWSEEKNIQRRMDMKEVADTLGQNGIAMPEVSDILKVRTGGLRNEIPLSEKQIAAYRDYAVSLGMDPERIAYSDNYNTGYNPAFDILLIGTDAYPGADANRANGLLSYKAAIAHEIVGHREAAVRNNTHFGYGDVLEEAQASIRAARFAPGLETRDRILLVRDALERLRRENISIRNVKHLLDIGER